MNSRTMGGLDVSKVCELFHCDHGLEISGCFSDFLRSILDEVCGGTLVSGM